MALGEKSKILIFGGTGYIRKVHGEGKHLPRPSHIRLCSSYNPTNNSFQNGPTQGFSVRGCHHCPSNLSLSLSVSVRAAIIH